MKPDVTIIIPAWNAARFIGNAVASARAQRGLLVQVVIADDASTDDTASVAKSLCGPDLLYIRMARNGGPSVARNAALDSAEGRWIAVLDADDTILADRLKILVQAAEAESLDVVTDNMWIAEPSGRRTLFFDEALDGSVEPLGLEAYIRRNLLFAPSRGDGYLKPVFRRAFLERQHIRYDPAMRIGEDFILMAEAMAQGARYARHRSAGYVYTTSAGSISHRLAASQARAMIDADLRFLGKYGPGLRPGERAAMRLHLSRLRDGAGFVAMVDAIKAGRIGALIAHAASRPAAIRHFAMPIKARLRRFA